MSAPAVLAVLWYIILPKLTNTLLVALWFTVLNIFSAFTLPYVLGPAAPEMMGPFMQRTFRDLNDPLNAITQAVIAFAFCLVFGLFYVPRWRATGRGAEMAAPVLRRSETDWAGVAFAAILTIVIIFPLLVVCTWAFANVWRFPNVIPQQFGLRYWHDTLARADVWNALWISIRLSVTVTLLSALICLPAAYAFARLDFPFRNLLFFSFLAAMPSRNSGCSSRSPRSSCSCTSSARSGVWC